MKESYKQRAVTLALAGVVFTINGVYISRPFYFAVGMLFFAAAFRMWKKSKGE